MKNLGLLVLGIVLGALAMYFYSNNKSEVAKRIEIVTPAGLISPKQASNLDKTYNTKHSIINDSLFKKSTDGGDNRSSWWALDEVENYINYAKNQTGELGYTMDGLRVYLGSYPDSNGETGLTTMFFVPTGYKNTSQGSMFSLQGGGDIPGADGLNFGNNGKPPSANYPQ